MSGMTKAERLEEMKRLYIQRAYSDIELAERLGVDRTLIYRDRIELTGQYPVERDDEGRYHIPRTKLISEIKVNLHEALTLYLAARKTSRQTRFHSPHAANALEKLAATLRQPMTEKLLKAADAVLKQEKDPERIKSAVLSGEGFDIPDDFDEQELLKHAWGIWVGDQAPITVKLRFSPAVIKRVKESIWHPLENVTGTEDGGCIWSADVAEWREMLPWVRGWGADVEVLEPKELRRALTREAQELAQMYKVMEEQVKQMVYYGHSRKDKGKSGWQLLKDHLFNTADLAEKFGADAGISELARTAALLHDIGKYSKEFQARLDGSKHKVDHATAGAKEIRNLFNKDQNQKSLADMLAYCISGHHTGLPDYGDSTDVDGTGTLLARVEKKPLKDFSAYKTEIDTSSLNLKLRTVKTSKENQGFAIAFLTRMIFSTLVDADFQETQNYMMDDVKPRGEYASIEELCEIFNTALQKFDNPQGEMRLR